MGSQQLFADRISFSYSETALLRDVSFTLHLGQKAALVGPNGSGKTSLLRILAGALEATGQVQTSSSFAFVQQHSQNSGVSGGEARLAALREAFNSPTTLLLLDEPTNDLDEAARTWFLHSLMQFSGAALIVSHDPSVLNAVDAIYEIKHGTLIKHPPGFESFVDRVATEETSLQEQISNITSALKARERKARAVIERQEKRASRGERHGRKANLPQILRGMKKRQAQNTLARLKTVQTDRTAGEREELILARQRLRDANDFIWDGSFTRPPASKRVCEVRDFVLLTETETSLRSSPRPVSFVLSGPMRVHLRGANGSGKSTLMRTLSGDGDARRRCSGDFFLGVRHSLMDQQLAQFQSSETLWSWMQPRLEQDVGSTRSILGRLGFTQDEQQRPVNQLSGGEKMRIELCLCLHRNHSPQLLLLDEPTNHLDLQSRRILGNFLSQFEGALIVSSHDIHFLNSLHFDFVVDLSSGQ
ncbi:MAG: ABC-F family ATP-binding cassette domain-containing protein [Leptospirales bacterium]|nr:ABC-F family ATP-binding cassette domain-containing protein [Leptospirales bacterium]